MLDGGKSYEGKEKWGKGTDVMDILLCRVVKEDFSEEVAWRGS